jgi:hypothetical protein
MDEQEQKGVTVPNRAASMFAGKPLNLPRIFLVLSGGKKLWIYEIIKISTERSINIFITSYIKNLKLAVYQASGSIPMDCKNFATSLSSHFIASISFCINIPIVLNVSM